MNGAIGDIDAAEFNRNYKFGVGEEEEEEEGFFFFLEYTYTYITIHRVMGGREGGDISLRSS